MTRPLSTTRKTLLKVGVPSGSGILFSASTRRRLVVAFFGSVLTAMLDMLGVAALLPMMQLITGADRETGALGLLADWIGPGATDQALAIALACIIVAAFSIKGTLTIAFRWWHLGFVTAQERETAVRLLRGYLAAPYHLYLQRGLPDFMRSLNDAVSSTYNQVVVGLIGMGTEAITILGLSVLLIVTSPVAALISLAYFAAAAVALSRGVRRHSQDAGRDALEGSLKAFRAASNAVGGMKEIRLRRNAEVFVGEFDRAKLQVGNAIRKVNFVGELPKYLLEIVFVVGMALMAALVFGLDRTDAALGTLAIFLAAGTRMLPSLVRAMASLNGVRFGLPAMRLLIQELHDFPSEAPRAVTPARPAPRGDIKVEAVSYRYPNTPADVLHEVDVTISQGSSLAIVGPSGSGKTTLVDMILGLHSPTSGRVLVNGLDIANELAGWQSSIGMVPQDVFWLDDTIVANIAFGVPERDRDLDRIHEAVRRAQLDDLVQSLPQGLDTTVGDGGARLSGGQRQRVGIARALYLDPQLIVLDEATSALDNLTERRISQTIDELRGQTTMIIVAHRLSTVRNCDQLIFLKNGRVVSRGTFDEVREQNDDFAHLVELGSLEAWERGSHADLSSTALAATDPRRLRS